MRSRKTLFERKLLPENIAPNTTVHRINVDRRRRKKVFSFEVGAGGGTVCSMFKARRTCGCGGRILRVPQRTALCGNRATRFASQPARRRRFATKESC